MNILVGKQPNILKFENTFFVTSTLIKKYEEDATPFFHYNKALHIGRHLKKNILFFAAVKMLYILIAH